MVVKFEGYIVGNMIVKFFVGIVGEEIDGVFDNVGIGVFVNISKDEVVYIYVCRDCM